MRLPFRIAMILGLAFGLSDGSKAVEIKPPNVLLILIDDFGQQDLSCYGSPFYQTPNMDRLAAEGARFTQAYVAYPRCVPSRFAIITGKHPAAFQKDRDSVHVEPGRDQTIGSAMQNAGYDTFYCGKWHLGDGASSPDRVGFATTVAAGSAGATRSHFAPYTKSRGGNAEHEEKSAIEGLDDAPADEYLTDRLTEETINFLAVPRERPFFAVLAHYAVHTPIEAKKHLTKSYEDRLASLGSPKLEFEKESAGENALVQTNAVYAAMIESVDHGVGRLLRQLERSGNADNTIVVLASDHGGLSARGGKREVATSNRPLRAGKGHLYEGGLRIPLIIRWPKQITAGKVIDIPVIAMDLYPTFLAAAGRSPEAGQPCDGTSLLDLLKTGNPPAARSFYWHNPAPRPSSTGDWFSSAIRRGNWKLIEFPENGKSELYDLTSDVGEAKNVAESHPEVLADLTRQLHQWKAGVGAGDAPRLRKKESRER